uniref:Uncharacterized protein n=1 Tax=Graphocephala atropunctata TaxID=36148 RepID=A0A1B6KCV4_9HEMI
MEKYTKYMLLIILALHNSLNKICHCMCFLSGLGLQPLSQPSGVYNPVGGIAAPLNSLYLSEVSVSEVETAVRRLRSTNAAGVDEIPCSVKENFAFYKCCILSHL